MSAPKRTIKVRMAAWRYEEIAAAAALADATVSDFMTAAATEAAAALQAVAEADKTTIRDVLAAVRADWEDRRMEAPGDE